MFLIIDEDQEIFKAFRISDDDLASADAGILDIIDIDQPCDPKVYFKGRWLSIKEINIDITGYPDACG